MIIIIIYYCSLLFIIDKKFTYLAIFSFASSFLNLFFSYSLFIFIFYIENNNNI